MNQEITEAVAKLTQEIIRLKGSIDNPLAQLYLTEQELKEQFGFGTTWLIQQRQTGKLPYRKVGRKIIYRISEVEKFLEKHVQK